LVRGGGGLARGERGMMGGAMYVDPSGEK
jgi:hypothetical protein